MESGLAIHSRNPRVVNPLVNSSIQSIQSVKLFPVNPSISR
jgi:hypothetical protein